MTDGIEDINRKLAAIDRIWQNAPRVCGAVAIDWIHERFRAQNWIGTQTEPWPKRKDPTKWGPVKNPDRALLVGHHGGGRLKTSIRIERTSMEGVVIATDVPYAVVHNEGYRAAVAQSVKAHTRNTKRHGTVRVRAHNRTIHQDIPARRFIGNSPYLQDKMLREINSMILKVIKS